MIGWGEIVSRKRHTEWHVASSVLDIQDRLLRAMSPESKLLASDALRRTAWQLKAAWIASQHPELDSEAIEERVRRAFLDAGA